MRNSLRPSPAIVVAVIALVVAMSGLAWAAVRIDTEQIKPAAVTTHKLARGAVKPGKLADAAVTTTKLADGSVATTKLSPDAAGVALAGIEVRSDGRVESWFNRLGGQPGVGRSDVGEYVIGLPGFDDVEYGAAIYTATLRASPGEIVTTTFAGSGSPIPIVRTFDSAGNPADRGFYYTIAEGDLAASP